MGQQKVHGRRSHQVSPTKGADVLFGRGPRFGSQDSRWKTYSTNRRHSRTTTSRECPVSSHRGQIHGQEGERQRNNPFPMGYIVACYPVRGWTTELAGGNLKHTTEPGEFHGRSNTKTHTRHNHDRTSLRFPTTLAGAAGRLRLRRRSGRRGYEETRCDVNNIRRGGFFEGMVGERRGRIRST
jgi:hypothetical protein